MIVAFLERMETAMALLLLLTVTCGDGVVDGSGDASIHGGRGDAME